MAKHEIMIHQNTGVTKESAPYLGSYLSKETIKSDAFAAKIAEIRGLTPDEAGNITTENAKRLFGIE